MPRKSVTPPFVPLQPEIDELTREGGSVVFPRIRHLREHIAYYFAMQTPGDHHSQLIMHGVPDGCVDLLLHTDTGTSSLIGLASRPVLVPVVGGVGFFGIRFFPGKIHQFLRLPAHEIYDKSWNLRELVEPGLDAVEAALLRAKSFQQQIEIAESALLRLLERHAFEEDPRYLDAVDRIYQSCGRIDVGSLAGLERISDRQLRRLFRETLGLSPKKLARVVRFQVALNRLRTERLGSLLELALDLGYYDQSHFINDFKELYGRTPSQLERTEPPWAATSGFSNTSPPTTK